MRQWAIIGMILLLATTAWTPPSSAEDEQEKKKPWSRLCLQEDMTGHVFKMVQFKEDPPDRETNWVGNAPYEYIKFSPNNVYASIASNKEMRKYKLLEGIFDAISGAGQMKYTLAADGTLTLFINGKVSYNYRCVAILRARDEYIPGDLVMTGYTRKNKSVITRIYRRWY